MRKVPLLRYLGSQVILQLWHSVHEWAIEDSNLGNITISLSIWGEGGGYVMR